MSIGRRKAWAAFALGLIVPAALAAAGTRKADGDALDRSAAGRGDATRPLAEQAERVVVIEAKKYEFSPGEIRLKKGEAVIFELHTADRKHGFLIPDFNIHADIPQGETVRVRWVPPRAGKFAFECNIFCGSGHEDMSGTIIVE
jgi:cytochrome c oxidase subunit II